MNKIRCLVALRNADTGYQIEQSAEAQAMAALLNMEVEIFHSENDAVDQSLQVMRAIQRSNGRRPEVIVMEPVGETAMPRVAQAACETGIAWVVLNQQPDYIPELRKSAVAPIFSLGPDQREIGRIQGRQFCALLPFGGTVLYLQGPSQNEAAQQRTAGMNETKSANTDVKLLTAQWTRESATRSLRNWLRLTASRQIRIGLVGAQNDSMAMGARLALEEECGTGKEWQDLSFTGCDGARDSGQQWVREGYLAATIVIPPNAGIALEMCHKALRSDYNPPAHTLIVPQPYPSLETLRNFPVSRPPKNLPWHLSHADY
jgi:ribose transport system substrate-binding protein